MNFLWVPITLIASIAQTGRNATQRKLTGMIGTVGATQVRFLYGLPFAAVALVLVRLVTGEAVPVPNPGFLLYVTAGAFVQIMATALMLYAMSERSFSVIIAYTKTEPVQVALFGILLLGDHLTPMVALAIVVATAGVVVMSLKPGASFAGIGVKTAVAGIAAGAFFALSAIGFRGAILSLETGSFLMRSTTSLVWSLAIQTGMLLIWLGIFDRNALMGSFRVWRTSLGAGFLGAFASQFWFLGFSLTTAANVRTLALVEVLMAQAVSHRFMSQQTTRREIIGMALIIVGVGLLLYLQR